MALPIALQLYSIRDYTAKDFYGALKAVKKMGYDGVEFAGLFNLSPAEVRKMVDEIGLVPLSAHVGVSEFMQDLDGTLARYAVIGCSYMAIPFLSNDMRPGAPSFADTLDLLGKIGKAAKEKGIQLLYHNHDFEFVKLDGVYGLDIIYDRVPADLLQTELDTCWVKVAGEDPAEYIRKYAGRAPIVHLKDFTGTKVKPAADTEEARQSAAAKSDFDFRPLGMGVQDIPAILSAAKDAGTKWVVVEMDKPCCDKTSLECAQISYDYLATFK